MKDFWIHLGAQAAMAALGGVVAVVSGANYSTLGPYAGLAQAVAAIGAEIYNQFKASQLKSVDTVAPVAK